MFDWLFEGRLTVYVALVVVAAALMARNGFALYRPPRKGETTSRSTRRRLAVTPIILGFVLLLAGVYFVLDRAVETRREQIERKLQEMASAVQRRDVDRIFAHISDRFQVAGMDKAVFRNYVEGYVRNGQVTELVLWEVVFPDEDGSVFFRAKPKGSVNVNEGFVRVHATFVRDPDGQWRMQTFDLFDPWSSSNTPVNLPR